MTEFERLQGRDGKEEPGNLKRARKSKVKILFLF